MVLEAIRYSEGSLEVLDQLQLPHKTHYDAVYGTGDAWHAIKDMRVRGAPAIAMVGILGVAVEIVKIMARIDMSADEAVSRLIQSLDFIVTSRPTAVNLRNMAEDFKVLIKKAAGNAPADAHNVWRTFLDEAKETLVIDVRDNKRLGDFGAEWLLKHAEALERSTVSVITHCNTGSLATAGYGTALGVVRSLHARGALRGAYCTETRPYNQGSRLTAFELVHDHMPATLITDSMAAALLRLRRESENIVGVVVGADRIAANGDTANKIGTYALALAARHHGVKFLVAAPCTTIDLETRGGDEITIEERAAGEMTTISGPVVSGSNIRTDEPAQRISIAAPGIDVWNPAFDVTPAELIDGIVTERGVVEKAKGSDMFDLTGFLRR